MSQSKALKFRNNKKVNKLNFLPLRFKQTSRVQKPSSLIVIGFLKNFHEYDPVIKCIYPNSRQRKHFVLKTTQHEILWKILLTLSTLYESLCIMRRFYGEGKVFFVRVKLLWWLLQKIAKWSIIYTKLVGC